MNWAVVLPEDASGHSVTVISGGGVTPSRSPISGGLNYGSTPGLRTGAQQVQLFDGSGNVVLTTNSAIDDAANTDGCVFVILIIRL